MGDEPVRVVVVGCTSTSLRLVDELLGAGVTVDVVAP